MSKSNTDIQDEIDLLDLMQALWKKKLLILSVALLISLVATAYMFFHKPIYEAKITMGAPITSQLTAINYARTPYTKLKPINTGEAYYLFMGYLFSDSIKNSYMLKVPMNTTSIVVQKGILNQSEVLVRAATSQIAIEEAKKFINFAHQMALKKLQKVINQEIIFAKLRIEKELNRERVLSDKERKNQLVRLHDALKTAELIGFEKPAPNSVNKVDISNPAYLRGSRALKAEIESLETRQSSDLFNPKIHILKSEYNNLNKFELVNDNLVLGQIHGKVMVSGGSFLNIKHIIFFLIFGFMIGIFFVAGRFLKLHAKNLSYS